MCVYVPDCLFVKTNGNFGLESNMHLSLFIMQYNIAIPKMLWRIDFVHAPLHCLAVIAPNSPSPILPPFPELISPKHSAAQNHQRHKVAEA